MNHNTEGSLRGLALAFIVLFSLAVCHRNQLHVAQIAEPDYPYDARFRKIEGVVRVEVAIGADGKVSSAKGSGADPVLVRASEENARTWVFGDFPPRAEFTMCHSIIYLYRLNGKPLAVAVRPTIKTFLPDRVEVVGVPLESDYPPLKSYKPIPNSKR
jgi:hypothetical protein